MFRLIQLYASDDNAIVDVDPDGYTTESAAWAEFHATPVSFFGVGRFDAGGRLVDIAVDPVCTAAGRSGLCRGPASVVETDGYHPLCADCGAWHDAVTLRELARRLGVPVQPARPPVPAPAPSDPGDPTRSLSHRIARELATRVCDEDWRRHVCRELTMVPRAVNGLFIGVGALSHRQVLDLFPALRHLAGELPAGIHDELRRAADRPRSPAGLAALRLGLSRDSARG